MTRRRRPAARVPMDRPAFPGVARPGLKLRANGERLAVTARKERVRAQRDADRQAQAAS